MFVIHHCCKISNLSFREWDFWRSFWSVDEKFPIHFSSFRPEPKSAFWTRGKGDRLSLRKASFLAFSFFSRRKSHSLSFTHLISISPQESHLKDAKSGNDDVIFKAIRPILKEYLYNDFWVTFGSSSWATEAIFLWVDICVQFRFVENFHRFVIVSPEASAEIAGKNGKKAKKKRLKRRKSGHTHKTDRKNGKKYSHCVDLISDNLLLDFLRLR